MIRLVLFFIVVFLTAAFDGQSQAAPVIDTSRVFSTTEFPYNAVCQLEIKRRSYKRLWLKQTSFTSTGFLINGQAILTNAHNLHSNLFSIVESVTINRGRQDDELPYTPIILPCREKIKKHVRSASKYSFLQRSSKRAQNDYALIILPEDIAPLNVMPISVNKTLTLEGVTLTILGYPGESDPKGFTNGNRMWQSRGKFEKQDSTNIEYDIWTETGSSGSPVTAVVDGRAVLVGIHAFPGKAVRIREGVLDEIEAWLGESR